MREFYVFLKKEMTEDIRTYKVLIMMITFVSLGILSALTAVFMPEIFKYMMIEGVEITMPDPVWTDSWMQFFKNVPQIGVIVLVLLTIGKVSKECQNKTLINIVTKGISRNSILLAKFVSSIITFTGAYLISVVITALYTKYYFNTAISEDVIVALLGMYIFFIFILGVVLFASVICKNEYEALMIVGGTFGALFVLRMFPKTNKWNPMSLMADGTSIIGGSVNSNELIPVLILTIAFLIGIIILTSTIFKRKKL